MVWIFFWGIVTGVGISFVGALFGVGFYIALREAFIKQLNEKKQEKQ
jgi:hypothetical protein